MRRRGAAVLALARAGATATAAGAFTATPEVEATPAQAQSSRIYAADGTLLATLHGDENREEVPLDRIADVLEEAVVAVEDERFWDHRGVDLRAVVRAAARNAEEGRVAEGGSTITQQYVKNVLLARERTVRRKVREAALAYKLEQQYSKRRILELYLNSIYFGNGTYGVQAASRFYFGVPAADLSLAQAATLAGIIRSPNATNPVDAPEAAAERRRTVLAKLVELGRVTPAEAEAADATPVALRDRAGDARYAAPYFVERVKRFILDDDRFGPTPEARRELLFRGGLRIHTTVDLRKQRLAEEAVGRVLSRPDRDPSAAVVSLEPRTGFVRALVGGRDFFGDRPDAKFDLATQGRRQAGSAFKPLVLAAALQKGIPLTRVYPAPRRLTLRPKTGLWEVDNYEGGGGGAMTLAEATVSSVNTVYAQLILDVGTEQAVALAADMGITSRLRPLPSAVLGTNEVSPLEMAAAYATFANRGMAVRPVFVTKVTAPDGSLLFEHHHSQKRVLPVAVVDETVGVLRDVVERGTAVNAKIGRPVAGKTGTAQAWRDAWFVGFTPDLVTSVWVGFPERLKSMVPPATRIRVTGGSWPAEIWQLYTSQALADVPVTPFPEPTPRSTTSTSTSSTSSTLPPGTFVLADLVGQPADAAQRDAERLGLTVRRRQESNVEYPPGYVFAQDPPAGRVVRRGSTVVLLVSTGTPASTVPDVLDRTEQEARSAVAQAQLTIRVIHEPDPAGDGSRAGRVWKQSPAAGTPADRGSQVTVWVEPPRQG